MSSISKKIRSHYIPQCVLRRFTDGNGKLHVHDKDRSGEGCFASGPNNLFVEKGLYGLSDRSKETDKNQLEVLASRYEAGFDDLVKQIETSISNHRLPRIHEDGPNKRFLSSYFAFSIIRTPQRKKDMQVSIPDMTETLLNDYERDTSKTLDKETREKITLPDNLETMGSDGYIRANIDTLLGKGMLKIRELLLQKDLRIVWVTDRSALVIGDAVFVRSPEGIDLREPNAEIIFPVSGKLALAWGPFNDRWELPIGRDTVRKINESMFRHSRVIASRAERLTKSLAGLK